MGKKILIADDHQVVLTGISLIIKSGLEDITIDQVENYSDVLEKISQTAYDLLIIDTDMPGKKNLKKISEIREIDSNIKVLVFSTHDDLAAIQYIRKGANGYINKLSTEEEIVDAIKKIFSDDYYYPASIVNKLLHHATTKVPINIIETLSEREYEILSLMVKGLGTLEIANNLDLQMGTVSTYKKRIYCKLKTKNFPDIITIYQKYVLLL